MIDECDDKRADVENQEPGYGTQHGSKVLLIWNKSKPLEFWGWDQRYIYVGGIIQILLILRGGYPDSANPQRGWQTDFACENRKASTPSNVFWMVP